MAGPLTGYCLNIEHLGHLLRARDRLQSRRAAIVIDANKIAAGPSSFHRRQPLKHLDCPIFPLLKGFHLVAYHS
jgi:hypothetical protein